MQILSSMLGWLHSKHILDVMTPMFGKTSHKMDKKCPNVTIDVDWDVKQKSNKQIIFYARLESLV